MNHIIRFGIDLAKNSFAICVASHTRIINQMRGLLAEFGIVAPKGANTFKDRWRRLRTEHAEREFPIWPGQHSMNCTHSCRRSINESWRLIGRSASLSGRMSGQDG